MDQYTRGWWENELGLPKTRATLERAKEIIAGLLVFADGHELREPQMTELHKVKQRAHALLTE